jgi:hypothetical protein
VALVDERSHLVDQAADLGGVLRVALNDELVALGPDLDVQERLQVPQVFVVGAEERFECGLGNGNLTRRCRCDSGISLIYSKLPTEKC